MLQGNYSGFLYGRIKELNGEENAYCLSALQVFEGFGRKNLTRQDVETNIKIRALVYLITTRNGRFLPEKRNSFKEYDYVRGLELFIDSSKIQ